MSIGIDFGTRLNKIGCFNHIGFKVISTDYRNSGTPSIAFIKNQDQWFFGEKAFKLGLNKPKQFICESKALLGQKLDNDQVEILFDKSESKRFYIYEIIGNILKNLIEVSKSRLPRPIHHTIFSIPAKFNKKQKVDLFNAAKFADFQNTRFVIEPILSTIAYLYCANLNPAEKRNILVYSFGFSNPEATIIKIHDETYDITIEKDEDLNGKQFDANVFEYINKELIRKYPTKCKFLEQQNVQANLKILCEEAKINLSNDESTDIVIKNEDDENDEEDEEEENDLSIDLTCEKFNEINNQLFDKAMDSVKKVMNEANVKLNEIDFLFLVGGLTNMKKIKENLKEITGIDPQSFTDPCEAPTLGACILGAYLLTKESSEIMFQRDSVFFDNLKVFEKAFVDEDFKEENDNVSNEQMNGINSNDLAIDNLNVQNQCESINDSNNSLSNNVNLINPNDSDHEIHDNNSMTYNENIEDLNSSLILIKEELDRLSKTVDGIISDEKPNESQSTVDGIISDEKEKPKELSIFDVTDEVTIPTNESVIQNDEKLNDFDQMVNTLHHIKQNEINKTANELGDEKQNESMHDENELNDEKQNEILQTTKEISNEKPSKIEQAADDSEDEIIILEKETSDEITSSSNKIESIDEPKQYVYPIIEPSHIDEDMKRIEIKQEENETNDDEQNEIKQETEEIKNEKPSEIEQASDESDDEIIILEKETSTSSDLLNDKFTSSLNKIKNIDEPKQYVYPIIEPSHSDEDMKQNEIIQDEKETNDDEQNEIKQTAKDLNDEKQSETEQTKTDSEDEIIILEKETSDEITSSSNKIENIDEPKQYVYPIIESSHNDEDMKQNEIKQEENETNDEVQNEIKQEENETNDEVQNEIKQETEEIKNEKPREIEQTSDESDDEIIILEKETSEEITLSSNKIENIDESKQYVYPIIEPSHSDEDMKQNEIIQEENVTNDDEQNEIKQTAKDINDEKQSETEQTKIDSDDEIIILEKETSTSSDLLNDKITSSSNKIENIDEPKQYVYPIIGPSHNDEDMKQNEIIQEVNEIDDEKPKVVLQTTKEINDEKSCETEKTADDSDDEIIILEKETSDEITSSSNKIENIDEPKQYVYPIIEPSQNGEDINNDNEQNDEDVESNNHLNRIITDVKTNVMKIMNSNEKLNFHSILYNIIDNVDYILISVSFMSLLYFIFNMF